MEPSQPIEVKDGPHVYLGLPTYNGESPTQQVFDIWGQAQNTNMRLSCKPFKFSMLTHAFNALWADALNMRETHGVTHFMLLHSDVVPNPGQQWVKTLVDEMAEKQADVLSVVIPIKTIEGLTSTGTQMGEPYHPWIVKRYTMHEIFRLPETFTHSRLVVNTGLILVDIRKPWVEKIFFNVKNDVAKNRQGKFEAICYPEDWLFSEEARALGASIWATRKVQVQHRGLSGFSNDSAWGGHTDQEFLKVDPMSLC